MDQEFIANTLNVKRLTEEIELLNRQIYSLQKELAAVQHQCSHVFLEKSGFRKCQKCGYTESTYF